MKDLHSLEELIVTAYEHLDGMSCRDISAVWARVPQVMSRRQPRHQSNPSSQEKLSKDDMQRMLSKIFDDTVTAIGEFDTRELTGTILGMAKILCILGKRRDQDSARVELRELLQNRNMRPKEELFQSFANVCKNKLDQFEARHLSNLAYAYALINYVPEIDAGENDLFDYIAEQSRGSIDAHEFKPQELSNMLWAYATVKKSHAVLFEAIGDEIVASKHLTGFRPQTLKDIVWAYAKADVRHPKLFEKVANHVINYDSLDEFKPQELSNTVWAFAKAGVHNPKLFEKVATHIVQSNSLLRFEPQACSNIVWAYATADIRHERLFEKVASHIVGLDRLVLFEPQALSNTVWAYATANISHQELFEKMAKATIGKLDRFTHPQDFSNTVWAYAKAGVSHPKLFDKMANRFVALDIFHRFDPQALSNTTWAYATAQVSHPTLFEEVAKAAIQRNGAFENSQHIANTVWAYATMGITDKQLFESFVQTVSKVINTCNNQEIANIAWAYAVADVDAPTLFNDAFINKCVKETDFFEKIALFQLYQWHLWQTKEKKRCNPGLPVELLDRSYKAFISEDPTISKLQDDVVSQLTSIGLNPKEEVLMDSGYRMDALVEVNGKMIGVEVDGPYHFVGKSRSPLGRTVLKRRQVPAIDGIELVSVPYWEWNKQLGEDEVKRREYLRKLLSLMK